MSGAAGTRVLSRVARERRLESGIVPTLHRHMVETTVLEIRQSRRAVMMGHAQVSVS